MKVLVVIFTEIQISFYLVFEQEVCALCTAPLN